jgi:hypothetical protein
MEDTELIALWKSYDQKLEESLTLNRRNAEDITRIKIRSLLGSMKLIKIFAILTGILWVLFVDVVIIGTLKVANPFFLVSAGFQVLITKIAIGIYLYQTILIYQTDISEPLLATQERIAKLQSSTIWVARILFLQFPIWTTFYINDAMLSHVNFIWLVIQSLVTIGFTILSAWLFVNIKFENRDKTWFRLIFKGKEWEPVLRAQELLLEIDGYKEGASHMHC